MRHRPSLRLECLEARTVPAVATWDGGGADNKWTTAANWQNDAAPQPGDDIVFPAGAARPASVNDFPAGTAFASITFTGFNDVLTGNRITLAGGVRANLPAAGTADADPQVNLDLTLAAAQTFLNQTQTSTPFGRGFTVGGTIDLNGHPLTQDGDGTVTFAGPVVGAGGLVKTGGSLLVLAGNNSYTGLTDFRGGFLQANTDTALGATGAGNDTVLTAGPSLPFLYLAGTGTNIAEAITFAGNIPSVFVQPHSDVTLSGPLTLAATGSRQVSFNLGGASKLTITRGLSESTPGNILTIGGTGVPDTTLVFAPTAVNTYTGGTTISNGPRVLFNSASAAPGPVTISDGSVAGTGTTGPLVVGGPLGAGGLISVPPDTLPVVAPGDTGALGALTTGDFTLNPSGRLVTDLADRLDVRGTVTLGGFLTVQPRPGLDPPPLGTHFRILDNDGTDPVQGTFARLLEGAVAGTFARMTLRVTYRGGDGNDVELITDREQPALAVGAGEGGGPQVNVYGTSGTRLAAFNAYDPAFRGGVRVATADLNGDGVKDVITAAGPGGGPHVRVFDGAAFANGLPPRELFGLMAYAPSFTGGVFVAAGDVDGDGTPDIVTGAGLGGGPHVRAFSGKDGSLLGEFMAYDPTFRGGVTVAVFGGQIVTGPGPGGGPDVRFFTDVHGTMGAEFDAFDPAFRGGIFVSAGGGTSGNSVDYVLVAAGPGGGPQVLASYVVPEFHPVRVTLTTFNAYDARFRGGVRVAAADLDGDGVDEVITAPGLGGGPHVEAWHVPASFGNGSTSVASSFLAFDPSFTGGVFVG